MYGVDYQMWCQFLSNFLLIGWYLLNLLYLVLDLWMIMVLID